MLSQREYQLNLVSSEKRVIALLGSMVYEKHFLSSLIFGVVSLQKKFKLIFVKFIWRFLYLESLTRREKWNIQKCRYVSYTE